jgi:peptide/nickel transport system substrate-binding protein
VTLHPAPIAEWLVQRVNGDFDAMSTAMFDSIDPDGILYGGNHTDGSVNFGKFSDPEIDRLAELQRQTFDPGERKGITDELQMKLLELSPQVWTFAFGLQMTLRSYVKDFTVLPGYRGWPWTEVWLDRD